LYITIPQADLTTGVLTVHRAVATNNTVPALTGILLRAEQDRLSLLASDNEISISSSVKASIDTAGGIILPARYLLDIVRKIPGGDIKIQVEKSNWTATITWGRSQFTVHGLEPEQFPKIVFESGAEGVKVGQTKIKDMIRCTAFAVAQNESRPVLTGELLEIRPGEVRMVAIDGVRLAMAKGEISWSGAAQRAVIPGRAANELSRLLSSDLAQDCSLSATENQVFFDLGETRFVSRLLEGQFPPYEQIVPSKFRTQITLGTGDFHDACERASLLSVDNDRTIKMEAKEDLLVITSSTPEVGKVREEVECSVEGDALEIAFNARYLIDGLEAIDSEKVLFQANGPYSPCCIKPRDNDNNIYVAMPLRTLGD
jgi:DNA polymerase-3 subunit beta